MEDFKRIIKMKTGGSVSKAIAAYEKRERKSEDKSDMAQDKAIVKKAIAMHDKQEHPGEKTNLSKLKKGGRSKKECGTVKKYKCGGGVFGAKKTKEDIKNMDAAKECKPKKLATGGLLQEPGKPAMASPMCGGGKAKKYAGGGSIDEDVRERARKWMEAGSPDQAEAPSAAAKPVRRAKAAKLPLPDYSNEDLDRMGMNKDIKQPESDREEYSPWMREYRREEAKARRSKRTPRQMLEEESEYTIKPNLQTKGESLMKSFGMKNGGNVKKCATGGSLKETNAEENPGLAKLPTNVRNKMGYMQKGGKAKKMNTGGTCS
jgi:hypothetical protein